MAPVLLDQNDEMAALFVRGLLFTDIEASTVLLRRLGSGFGAALQRHQEIIRSAVGPVGGVEQSREGDSMFITFPSASAAVHGAVDAQRRLEREVWPGNDRVRVRMGLHVGEVAKTGAGLVGVAIHEAARIMSSAHGGQIVASADVREHAERVPTGVTMRTLGTYELRDVGRVELCQIDHPDLEREFPAIRTRRSVFDNLPSPLTSLIGRTQEAAAVELMLEEHRLVTLLGAGGAGKTRLALRVATLGLARFVDGVWFVDLSPLAPGMDVTPQLAHVLGMSGGREEVLAALRDRDMLLVFDNCEQVAESVAAVLVPLLASCPSIRVLATSRAPLEVAGEVNFPVRALSVPHHGADLDEICSAEAVQLFVARATVARPDFQLDRATAGAVAALCARLDGLPLAIELAAARLRGMSLGELCRRIEDRFAVLAGGPRSAPHRQQTMRNTMDWTFRLLDADAQSVLRQLAVFRRGCDLEAAEVTCVGMTLIGRSLVDVLIELVDKSLLSTAEVHGVTRYTLHEVVREYVLDSAPADERVQAQERHARWFCDLADHLLHGPDPGGDLAWIHRHDDEQDNFRAAAEWLSLREPGRALRLLLAIDGGSYMTLQAAWIHDLISRLLPAAGGAPHALRAWATAIVAWDLRNSGRVDEARALSFEALELLVDSDDPVARCNVMTSVAVCRSDAAGGALDDHDVADAVSASDRAGGTFWPIITRYSLTVASPPQMVVPLISEALRLAVHNRLDFFADAVLGGHLAVGTQFRDESAAVLSAWRELVPRLGDLGLYHDENGCFYALAEGEHANVDVGLHLAEHCLSRLRALRCDPSSEARLRWVAAHLYRLRGDLDRAAEALDLADRLAAPTFDFLGGLANITRAALLRRRGLPHAAASSLATNIQHYPHAGLTDIPMRVLEELAAVACTERRRQDGADLLATAAADRQRQGKPLSPQWGKVVSGLHGEIGSHRGVVLDAPDVRALGRSLTDPGR